MLGQRPRSWPNIGQTLGGCLGFVRTSGATMSCDLQLLFMIENDTLCHAELLSLIAVHGRNDTRELSRSVVTINCCSQSAMTQVEL